MAVFVGLDVHRAQITFDALDNDTGEVQTGRVHPGNRHAFRLFLRGFDGADLVVAVEAMSGWRFVVEELQRIGAEVHLAEPAEVSTRRDTKRRAKTDRLDARLLRELLMERRLPEAWIPPSHLLDLRAKVRLRKTLVNQRTQWLQRIHAVLFHHGVAVEAGRTIFQGCSARMGCRRHATQQRTAGTQSLRSVSQADPLAARPLRVRLTRRRPEPPRGLAGSLRAPWPSRSGAARHTPRRSFLRVSGALDEGDNAGPLRLF